MSSSSHIEHVLSEFLFRTLDEGPLDITVALSGGIDSVVLLHACWKLKQHRPQVNLAAIHIHHGISVNADDWLSFCTKLCYTLSIPLQTARVNVEKHARKSLESLARDARYTAINELAKPGTTVLLAQHEDDQAETVLLQMKRGAGPKGLSGMAERFSLLREKDGRMSSTSAVKYARPWINNGVSKSHILDYAQQAKLQWVEDESNQDSSFDRNFLRQTVMPLLKEKWPQITHTITRSARHCASQTELVEALAKEALSNVLSEDGGLRCRDLLVLPNAMQNEVLRLWAAQFLDQSPSQMQLAEILKLAKANEDKNGKVVFKTHQCRRDRMTLFLIPKGNIHDIALPSTQITIAELKNSDQAHGDLHFSIQDHRLTIHYVSQITRQKKAMCLDLSKKATTLTISYGDLSRRFKADTQRPSKTLKAWMKEANLPEWQRLSVPVIELDSDIAALLV
jgi:tRNA(Ile)-lysidine synthase